MINKNLNSLTFIKQKNLEKKIFCLKSINKLTEENLIQIMKFLYM